ncbi:MAG: restriction endonuclease subunit S [Veillonella sp.]|uniref:restriction endonuclease subunit S n=1 Tax=Veillonella sp. TaxID=1926307 RepID=UPI0029143462|nr:restriction endonuclease subunit S [Veillonella sp.]MDU5003092.1 restriction endonuclease subunit S [Veillonella sp.]
MMSKEKRRVPKLRFPGFTEDWEQRKLSDITYLSGIKNKENKPYESYSISNEFGFIPQAEQFENGGTMQTADKSMYYIVSQNSFAYNPARINVGSIGYYDKPDNVIVSSLYEVFKTTDIVNDKFLWHWFKSNQFNRLIGKYQEGGVRLYFYYDKLCKGTMGLPAINEQNKISNLLDDLDMYITLHQRKLDNLKLKKKALLQKLFPKNGERYPELRFPGFTDTWEQRKLDDIAKIKTGGGTPKTANPEYWSGNIPWIQSSDLVEGDIVHVNINKFINNNALKNSAAKLISRDSIALVTRVGVGKVAVINQDFTTSQDFLSLSDFDGNDIKFLAYQLYRLMQENAKVLQGTSIKGITKTELIEQSISIPSSGQEQNLISNVLSKIDSIITLHQRKLDHLQLQKKALLQQIFV